MPIEDSGAFRGHWAIKVYDNLGNGPVDIPQSDVLSIELEDVLNGGSGQATIQFQRNFNQIGNLGFGYLFQIWIWAPGQTMPTDPYYSGHFVDFDQEQMEATGCVTAKLEGDFKFLDAAIMTEAINPGVSGNPNLSAKDYLTHILTTYQPPSFAAPSITPAAMPNLLAMQFDGAKLGAAVDTVIKSVRDASGLLYVWFVRTKADLTRKVLIEVDQNPNVVTSVIFKHLFLQSQIDQYKISTLYRDIINTVSVYGGTDPITGQQVFAVALEVASVTAYGPIEDKITVPALMSNAAAQSYANCWLDLHAFPQAQGSFRLLVPDYTVLGGTWVQIWETPVVVKQVRAAVVKVTIKGERIEQVVSTVSPVPYLDDAVYRMGVNVATQAAIQANGKPANTQNLFIRYGCTISTPANNQWAMAAGQAVFPIGVVTPTAIGATTLVDNSGLSTNGENGDGPYTLYLKNNGTVIVKKHAPLSIDGIIQKLAQLVVVAGVVQIVDRRVLWTSQALNGTLDNQGNLISSTPFNPQGSINPFVCGIVVSSAGSYPGIGTPTITISWTAGTIIWPDGITVTSVSAGSIVRNGLTAGVTYQYAGVYWDTKLAAVVVIPDPPSTALPTLSQDAAINFDYRVGICSEFTCATPAGSGGSTGGGGGHGQTCPGVEMPMRTAERGDVRAGDLQVGEHLIVRGQSREIYALHEVWAEMVEVGLDGGSAIVDVDHHWFMPDGASLLRTFNLALGSPILRGDGSTTHADFIRRLGQGRMMRITIEGDEIEILGALGHNFPTVTL